MQIRDSGPLCVRGDWGGVCVIMMCIFIALEFTVFTIDVRLAEESSCPHLFSTEITDMCSLA